MSGDELPWFRMYTDAVDNVKLRMVAFEDRWHYVAIMCLKRQGLLDKVDDPNFDRMLSIKLGLAVSDLFEVKRRLLEVDLIDEHVCPVGWTDRQFESDSSTERVRKYRARQKGASQERHGNVSVTVQDTDTDTDTDKTLVRNESFKTFWNQYPRRESKAKAETAFARLTAKDRDALLAHLPERIDRHLSKLETRYIPMPGTFINQRRWLDEYEAVADEVTATNLRAMSDSQLLKLAGERKLSTHGLNRDALIIKLERAA